MLPPAAAAPDVAEDDEDLEGGGDGLLSEPLLLLLSDRSRPREDFLLYASVSPLLGLLDEGEEAEEDFASLDFDDDGGGGVLDFDFFLGSRTSLGSDFRLGLLEDEVPELFGLLGGTDDDLVLLLFDEEGEEAPLLNLGSRDLILEDDGVDDSRLPWKFVKVFVVAMADGDTRRRIFSYKVANAMKHVKPPSSSHTIFLRGEKLT